MSTLKFNCKCEEEFEPQYFREFNLNSGQRIEEPSASGDHTFIDTLEYMWRRRAGTRQDLSIFFECPKCKRIFGLELFQVSD